MTRRDPSQMPIEQLAQLLVQYARADAALPRRTPANDDAEHAKYVDDMFNRIEALPELRRDAQAIRREPQVSSPVVPATAAPSNEDLEELVAIALESAQDAEDISREAQQASRKARRGMFVAIALAAVGIAIAGAATISTRLYGGDSHQMAEIARQVQTLGDLQRHINDRLADLHQAASVQSANETSAAPHQPSMSVLPPLAPLKAIQVSVLPAEPAAPQSAPATTGPSPTATAARLPSSEASFAPAAPYTTYRPPAGYAPRAAYPRAAYHRTWTPYRPRFRRYPIVVLPRSVALLIGTVQRDMRTLLR